MNTETKLGKCYQFAANTLCDRGCRQYGLRPILVHGNPKLGKDHGGIPKGTRFGHAWIELVLKIHDSVVTVAVVDCGSLKDHKTTFIPSEYYRLGDIKLEDTKRYTTNEAREMMLKHSTFGPWGETES